MNIINKLKNYVLRKYNHELYWQKEIGKVAKFKIGDYIVYNDYYAKMLAPSTPFAGPVNTIGGNSTNNQYKIVSISVEGYYKGNNVYSAMIYSNYVMYSEKTKGHSYERITNVEEHYKVDIQTTSDNSFNNDLKGLLK